MNKLIPRISGYGYYTRAYAQTHVFKISACKGFQWVLFVASEQTGPRKAHQTTIFSWKGFRMNPFNPSELVS